MKGYRADAKTKKVELVDDGLPFPVYPPYTEPEGVDLLEVKKLLEGNILDRLKALEEKTARPI